MSAMASDGGENDAQAQLRKAILSIMTDTTLSEAEKAKKRQELMMGGWKKTAEGSEGKKEGGDGKSGSKAGGKDAFAFAGNAVSHLGYPTLLGMSQVICEIYQILNFLTWFSPSAQRAARPQLGLTPRRLTPWMRI
jgi:hypothetical protein